MSMLTVKSIVDTQTRIALKHFHVSFDHEDKNHALFLKTIWLPHILVLEYMVPSVSFQ